MPSLLMSRAILSQKSFSSIAILLVENGADIHQKNTKDQSPVDLCPDPHLYKVLYKTYEEVLQGTKSHVDFAFRTDQFEPPHLRQNQWRDRKLRSKSAKRIDGRDVAVAKPRNLGIPKQPEATARNRLKSFHFWSKLKTIAALGSANSPPGDRPGGTQSLRSIAVGGVPLNQIERLFLFSG
jgi:hypothetical protein